MPLLQSLRNRLPSRRRPEVRASEEPVPSPREAPTVIPDRADTPESVTDHGIRHAGEQIQGVREAQEDDWGFIRADGLDPAGEHPVAVVADGMGGHAAGDVASRVAIKEFVDSYAKTGPATERLRSALDRANAALRSAADSDAALLGMGTTLVAAAVTSDGLHWISVGDSPLYLFRAGRIERVNADHSMRPVIAAIEKEDPELALEYSPHQLRSVLMGERIPKIDAPAEAKRLEPGDIVLVATDGLETLPDEEIEQLVGAHCDDGPEGVRDALLQAVEAAENPRQDNTTVVVIEVRRSEASGKIAEEPTAPDDETPAAADNEETKKSGPAADNDEAEESGPAADSEETEKSAPAADSEGTEESGPAADNEETEKSAPAADPSQTEESPSDRKDPDTPEPSDPLNPRGRDDENQRRETDHDPAV